MRWLLLHTGFRPGRSNMDLDERLAFHVRNTDPTPILRFYGWHPPALSIGYHQHPESFDRERLLAAGMDLIRRPTGGRAILHAHELTYSVILPVGNDSPRTIYERINQALLAGVRLLGIEAGLVRQGSDFRTLYRDSPSIPCFTSSARSEIQYQGKKLIGSAQRRYGSVILQHGSFLLGQEHRRITEFLNLLPDGERAAMEQDIEEHTIEAETILGRTVTFDEAAACMQRGFEQTLDLVFDTTTEELLLPYDKQPVAIEESPS